MLKSIFSLSILLICIMTFATQTFAQNDKLPPLIDRELLFGNPEISGAQISPDGKFIAFVKPYKDTRNIWVRRVDEPFEKAKLITNRTDRPIPSYFWSYDGKYILFTQDKGGDENFNVYAVNPNDTPKAGEEVPTARNITDAQKVRAIIFAVPETEPDAIYVGLNDREPAWHDLYKVKISTGERTLISKNTDRLQGVILITPINYD
jgi:Tol biopolymer transport system component